MSDAAEQACTANRVVRSVSKQFPAQTQSKSGGHHGRSREYEDPTIRDRAEHTLSVLPLSKVPKLVPDNSCFALNFNFVFNHHRSCLDVGPREKVDQAS